MHSIHDSDVPSRGPSSSNAYLADGLRALPGAMRRILLATDLTSASEVATDWAFARSRGGGSRPARRERHRPA